MVIDDARLVQGLIRNLTDLASLATDPQAQAAIRSSQTIAMELWRRADVRGAITRYAAGRALITDAADSTSPGTSRQRQVLRELLSGLPLQLPTQLDTTSRDALFEEIRRGISLCVDGSHYPNVQDTHLREVLDSMFEWERAEYALRQSPVLSIPAGERLVEVDSAMLENYLRNNCPGFELANVTAVTPITGGFSKQTILFDVDLPDRREGFVYRGGTKIQIIEPVLVDIAHEFQVVAYAFSMGAAVAEPRWLQSSEDATGTRFFISRRAPGATLGTAVAAHQPVSAAATRALAEALAGIHGLLLDPGNALLRLSHLRLPAADASLDEVIRRRVREWRAYFRSLKAPTYPMLELAFQWLLDNAAAADVDTPVLVHGDYGLHNILVHEDRVTAVLDWEACHVGDRALDLSHIFAGTAGKMDHVLFMEAYIAAGGRAVSPFRLKYYQVLMNMQFMLSTIDAQHIFQRRVGAGTQFCTLGLGLIEYTASNVLHGIIEAGMAEQTA